MLFIYLMTIASSLFLVSSQELSDKNSYDIMSFDCWGTPGLILL